MIKYRKFDCLHISSVKLVSFFKGMEIDHLFLFRDKLCCTLNCQIQCRTNKVKKASKINNELSAFSEIRKRTAYDPKAITYWQYKEFKHTIRLAHDSSKCRSRGCDVIKADWLRKICL